jgi:ubiquinone/menaquinone biosynthesis C-methylase UbiE
MEENDKMKRTENSLKSGWDDKAQYLADSWILRHNDDYLVFLVDKVWKLKKPCRVVDFGCGYGRFGLKFMPLLPKGSTYYGFDESSELIARAQDIWQDSEIENEFSVSSVFRAPYDDNRFDVAVSHTVLMHIPNPEKAINEMIRVTCNGGLIITCDANRNAHSALFHIEETQEQEAVPLSLLQTMNGEIRRKTGVDYNIGTKTPVLMHKAGLKNVGARMSDSIRLLFPPIQSNKDKALLQALCNEGYGPDLLDPIIKNKWIDGMIRNGVSQFEAEREIDRLLTLDFANKSADYHTVYTDLMTFSFGTVNK